MYLHYLCKWDKGLSPCTVMRVSQWRERQNFAKHVSLGGVNQDSSKDHILQFPNLGLPSPVISCLKAGVKEGLQAKHGECTSQHPVVFLTTFLSVCIFPESGREKISWRLRKYQSLALPLTFTLAVELAVVPEKKIKCMCVQIQKKKLQNCKMNWVSQT